ncbi:MAG: hypothetical protein MRQ09_03080 [Candidatus Midichloria sp.]|nr:hypothetical protein [Candidatus Midichloria sp.]
MRLNNFIQILLTMGGQYYIILTKKGDSSIRELDGMLKKLVKYVENSCLVRLIKKVQ